MDSETLAVEQGIALVDTVEGVRHLEFSGADVVVAAILVLYLGELITRHVRFLRDNNIHSSVRSRR